MISRNISDTLLLVVTGATQRTLGVSVTESWIGAVPQLAPLTTLLDFVIDDLAVPYFNSHAAGLPVPQVSGIDLQSPTLALTAGELVVATDIGFGNNTVGAMASG